jgi:hypothetical protein
MSTNRLPYDDCAYNQSVHVLTDPLYYQLYLGKHENCNRCSHPTQPRNVPLVDIESELKNQTRAASLCANMKYSPYCTYSNLKPYGCLSTYDQKVPVEIPPELCLYDHNFIDLYNVPRPTDNGIPQMAINICKPPIKTKVDNVMFDPVVLSPINSNSTKLKEGMQQIVTKNGKTFVVKMT